MADSTKNDLEIEVKFFLSDEKEIRRKISALGGNIEAKVFETNVRYDDHAHSLHARQMLLRLRKDKQIRLTVKMPPAQQNNDFKILRELEVTLDDFDTMDQILATLGYHRTQIYEKWRETVMIDRTTICLDTMPFGKFLEIEGSKEKIRSTANALSLDWDKRILSNYIEIFEYLKQKEAIKFNDVTFMNFEEHPIQFNHYCHFFEGGKTNMQKRQP